MMHFESFIEWEKHPDTKIKNKNSRKELIYVTIHNGVSVLVQFQWRLIVFSTVCQPRPVFLVKF